MLYTAYVMDKYKIETRFCLYSIHSITEWQRLEGTSRGHLVQARIQAGY